MEAAKEETGFLGKIRPPRREEAGLEDCALPPDLIKEAFLKAATAVSSRVTSVLSSSDGECLNDPLPGETSPPPEDAVVGSESIGQPSEPCAAEKGGTLIGDRLHGADLVGSDIPEAKEDVIVPPAAEEKERGDDIPCVDGLRGLTIGEKEIGEGGDEEEEGDGPILVEGYLV